MESDLLNVTLAEKSNRIVIRIPIPNPSLLPLLPSVQFLFRPSVISVYYASA